MNSQVTTYRELQDLIDTDAAYIGGLIDGEGTITLIRKHKNENRQLSVSISSTEIALLDYVKSVTGVGKITNKRTSKPHHTPSFAYAVYNRQALALLQKILPYLKSYKRQRAEIILRDYVKLTPRNGKYTSEIVAEKIQFENTVLAIKSNS